MSLIISLKVVPSSHKAELVLDKTGKLKVYLKSPPEGGRANSELIKLFARLLRCPQSAVTLVAGATSRRKKLHLDLPLSYDEMLATLGCAVQIKLPHL